MHLTSEEITINFLKVFRTTKLSGLFEYEQFYQNKKRTAN